MARFYRALLVERRTPAAALRQAQLAVRGDRRWRSPYYWSPFVFQGDWK
jgi:CHAT domain-containing protein